MNNTICTLVGLLIAISIISCGKNHCTECLDEGGTIEVSNSDHLDWLYLLPNVFHSKEASIAVYFGGHVSNTTSNLSEVSVVRATIAFKGDIIVSETGLENLSGSAQNGYTLRIPVVNVSESISRSSAILDFDIYMETASEQTLTLDGRIQYIDCDLIDFDEFDSKDCRWSGQLKNQEYQNCPLCE